MKTLKEQFIVYLAEEVVRRSDGGAKVRIMDLGCGTAGYVPQLLQQMPNIEYVGVEPIKASYDAALQNLQDLPDCKVHFQLGYDAVPDEAENSFDLVFSLSVLEHIKQLDRFIALGAKYVKKGGLMVHRYDLGHALHPHSLKEQIHVWMGNTVPSILPERQFVRYVGVPEVKRLYEANGVGVQKITHHQMPSHKAFEKHFNDNDTTAVQELFDWEVKHQEDIATIPTEQREKLFPAVAVWGVKN